MLSRVHRATDVDMTGALRNEHVTGDAWGRAYLRQCEATEWTRAEALSLGTQETRRSGRGFSSRPLGGNSLALNASHGMDYKVFVALQ